MEKPRRPLKSRLQHRLAMDRNIARFALRSLRRAPMRSCLTALGLVVGVAGVIAMVGIGNGATARIKASIATLDSNQMVLGARLQTADGRWVLGFTNGDGLNVQDYLAIRSTVPGIAAISPQLPLQASDGDTVTANGRMCPASVSGVDVQSFELDSRVPVRGSVFGEADVNGSASVCVISQSVADALFRDSDPIGELLKIQKVPFLIVGVVPDRASANNMSGLYQKDAQVSIPYTSLLRRIDRNAEGSMLIVMRGRTPEALSSIQQNVSNLMEERRGKRKASFTTNSVADTVEAYTNNSRTLTLLLAFVNATSLIVGGIGIMNVMLIGVRERTREIGIRIAIGAREGDVLRQFLLEAVILSILGGIVGIVLGLGAARMVSRWNDWPVQVTPMLALGAFILSSSIGIVFGYYPARRAARLSPIEALRSE